jgi:hypothetical protein
MNDPDEPDESNPDESRPADVDPLLARFGNRPNRRDPVDEDGDSSNRPGDGEEAPPSENADELAIREEDGDSAEADTGEKIKPIDQIKPRIQKVGEEGHIREGGRNPYVVGWTKGKLQAQLNIRDKLEERYLAEIEGLRSMLATAISQRDDAEQRGAATAKKLREARKEAQFGGGVPLHRSGSEGSSKCPTCGTFSIKPQFKEWRDGVDPALKLIDPTEGNWAAPIADVWKEGGGNNGRPSIPGGDGPRKRIPPSL